MFSLFQLKLYHRKVQYIFDSDLLQKHTRAIVLESTFIQLSLMTRQYSSAPLILGRNQLKRLAPGKTGVRPRRASFVILWQITEFDSRSRDLNEA